MKLIIIKIISYIYKYHNLNYNNLQPLLVLRDFILNNKKNLFLCEKEVISKYFGNLVHTKKFQVCTPLFSTYFKISEVQMLKCNNKF